MSKPVSEVVYMHRYEYRSRRKDGSWTEPVIQFHNITYSEEKARQRHKECKDHVTLFDREFEGVWGYSYKNCELIRRESVTFVAETVLEPTN